jgi:hypothetical protein
MMIDMMREETIPLMREAKVSIERTNVILESAGTVATRVEKLSGLVEQAAASPLIKVISFGAGIRKAASRFTGKRGKGSTSK